MFEKKVETGQPCANVLVKVVVHRDEFMHYAELAAAEPPDHGPIPIDSLEMMVSAIQFARRNLEGNWIMTKKNYVFRKDAGPGLEEKSATLEIDLMNAAYICALKKAIQKNSSTSKTPGIEIEFSSGFPDYIKYDKGQFYFRDAAIDAQIDEIFDREKEHV